MYTLSSFLLEKKQILALLMLASAGKRHSVWRCMPFPTRFHGNDIALTPRRARGKKKNFFVCGSVCVQPVQEIESSLPYGSFQFFFSLNLR